MKVKSEGYWRYDSNYILYFTELYFGYFVWSKQTSKSLSWKISCRKRQLSLQISSNVQTFDVTKLYENMSQSKL